MGSHTSCVHDFFQSENGVTFVEYALLGALIAVVCAATAAVVGIATESLFSTVCKAVVKSTNGSGC